jgi:hypothetical protein
MRHIERQSNDLLADARLPLGERYDPILFYVHENGKISPDHDFTFQPLIERQPLIAETYRAVTSQVSDKLPFVRRSVVTFHHALSAILR